MKINKIISIIATLFLLCSVAFASVAVKDLGNGDADVTFTYKDDAATEMSVIGSFDNWTEPGEAMTKNANGEWEYTLRARSDDEITYKFWYKGTYIFDFKAPDKKDDGFGGNNGLIVVADLLTSSGNGASAGQASGATVGAVARKKLSFGTTTYFASETNFNTDNTFDFVSSDLKAKSVWKLEGDIVTKMPAYFEISFFDGTNTIVSDDVSFADGMKNFATGMLFSPAFYLDANNRPTLDATRFGFDTKYVSYQTGLGNIGLPVNKSVLWTTVTDDIKANKGYAQFSTNQEIGSVGVNAILNFNQSLNDYSGMYGIVEVTLPTVVIEAQYNMQSAVNLYDGGLAKNIFKKIPKQDIILGASAYVGQFGINAQALYINRSAKVIDNAAITKKLAGDLEVTYLSMFENWSVTFGGSYRGLYAENIFLTDDKNNDSLGSRDTFKVKAKGFANIGYYLVAKLEADAVFQNEKPFDSNIAVSVKPSIVFDYSFPLGFPLVADVYTKLAYGTKPSEFNLNEVGVKLLVEKAEIFYGFNNNNDVVYNTLVGQYSLTDALNLQLGFALRNGDNVKNVFGTSVGATYALTAPKSPVVYAQFLYGMNPYDADELYVYDLDGYLLDDGPSKFDGNGAVRLGIKWEF